MAELCGWAGSVLHVDLTDRKITKVPTTEYQPEKFIGGVGLNTKIFWDMGCPRVAAFDPGNPLLISVGPLTGLPGPFNRAEICGIGAQNYPQEQYTYSGFGGRFTAVMKYAGYDAIVIVGKADKPVYLSIRDEEVTIEDASDLWGLDLFETQRVVMSKEPGASVLAIGPAGENRSRIAVIATETWNTAGQGGFGGVMGSKNLKAISIRGTGSVKIGRPDDFLKLLAEVKAYGDWKEGAAQRLLRTPLCGGNVEKELTNKYRKKCAGSYGCPFQCLGFYDVPGIGKGAAACASWWYGWFSQNAKAAWEGQLVAQKLGINHYELLGLMIVVAESIMYDVLRWEDWEGLGLPPIPDMLEGSGTDHDFLTALLYGIAESTSPFSQGIARAMDPFIEKMVDKEKKEAMRELLEIKYPAWGYTNHFYGWLGLCLHVALDTRDVGNSTDGYMSLSREDYNPKRLPLSVLGEHFGLPYGPSTYAYAGGEIETVWEGAEVQSAWVINNQALKDSLTMCDFACLPATYFHPPEMDIKILERKLFSTVTGIDTDAHGLWKIGERIWNLRRAVLMRTEDRTRQKDTYADRFFDRPWTDLQADFGDGELVTKAYIDKEKFEALKDRYYKLAGWDVKTGWPTRAKLEELDLKFVADELEAIDKLP